MNGLRSISGAALLALVIGCGDGGRAAAADAHTGAAIQPLAIGDAPPPYVAALLADSLGIARPDSVRVAAGGPVTLLNVWATWCESCQEEMADLDSLHREFGGRGLRVIGVSVDKGDGTRVRRYAEAQHLAFSIAHDPDARIEDSYQTVGVPETYLVGKDGRLRWRHAGNLHPVLGDVRSAITRELASASDDRTAPPTSHD